MKIQLICPAPPGSLYGNRISGLRWARILRRLGHRVRLTGKYDGKACDLLVALHARHTAGSVEQFRKQYPDRPLIVTLTGTDIYGELRRHGGAW